MSAATANTLFPALSVLEGTVIGRCMQTHRRLEFIRFLNAVERKVPAGKVSLGNALIWAKEYQALETSAAFARARELANRVEDASERFSAYYGLWIGHQTRCEPAPAREMAELFLSEATARPDCPEALVAHRIPAPPAFISAILLGP
jgi:hypothetical protein